jgi:uncharacterized protein YmfQ (DUF2313 family)
MELTVDDYLALLQALLPTGPAWATDDPDSILNEYLAALAVEYVRLHARAEALMDEADPRTTLELLADFERVLGLPDTCVEIPTTTTERRQAVITKMLATGGASPQYFIDLAATYGYEITITEFDPYTVESEIDAPLYGDNWVYWWQVNAPLNSITYFDMNSVVTDPLASWGNDRLECLIRKYKPAYTNVIFSYT